MGHCDAIRQDRLPRAQRNKDPRERGGVPKLGTKSEPFLANQFHQIFAARKRLQLRFSFCSLAAAPPTHEQRKTRWPYMTPHAHRSTGPEFPPMCEVPCILHTVLHLEESRNKEQRKAGGFNYDILDELLGLERTRQTGFSSRPLTTHDGQRIRQAEISA
jgi:hypothetical protein